MFSLPRRLLSSARFAAAGLLLALPACGGSSTANNANSITINAGQGQTALHGTAVAIPPSVLVATQAFNPVSGYTVTFSVTGGGGSITGASAITDASGIATVGSWTLGPVAGPNELTVTATGLAGSGLKFTATGSP